MYKYIYLVAVVIALGLVLRFGKTSTTLLKDTMSGTNSFAKTLALYGYAGNTP